MMETRHALARPYFRSRAALHRRRRLRHRAPRHRPHPRQLARAAGDRAIAEAAGVTPTELHHLFRRWAGLTPKAFLQALTLDSARKLLRDSASVLDATYEVGLSGPGRLHDLFVTHEAMSPGEWKTGGEGLTIHYGFHPSPFGTALVMATERGLAGLAFADPGEEEAALADMRAAGRSANYVEDSARTAPLARRIFDQEAVARGPAAARRADRHRLRGAGVGDAAAHPDGPRSPPIPTSPARSARRRPRARSAPRSARTRSRFVVPCHRVIGKSRRAHRLSLGPDAQARHARLGSGQTVGGLDRSPRGAGFLFALSLPAADSLRCSLQASLRNCYRPRLKSFARTHSENFECSAASAAS